MTPITPKRAQAYFDRWRTVGDRELAESRKSSMDVRLRQLSTLVDSRRLFGEDPDRKRGVAEVRERWAGIRRASNG